MVETSYSNLSDSIKGFASIEWDEAEEVSYIRAADQNVGQLFKVLRQEDIEYEAKRVGGSVIAEVETDEPTSLKILFG